MKPICPKCKARPCEIAGTKSDGNKYYRTECWKCRSIRNPNYDIHRKTYRWKLKIDTIKHYGGKCECCNEKEILFLTIDHINGGGNKHRKEIGSGFQIYRWLKQQKYPKDFRVLCFNCNCGRQLNNGICPHHK
jgi:hypothetical protein